MSQLQNYGVNSYIVNLYNDYKLYVVFCPKCQLLVYLPLVFMIPAPFLEAAAVLVDVSYPDETMEGVLIFLLLAFCFLEIIHLCIQKLPIHFHDWFSIISSVLSDFHAIFC